MLYKVEKTHKTETTSLKLKQIVYWKERRGAHLDKDFPLNFPLNDDWHEPDNHLTIYFQKRLFVHRQNHENEKQLSEIKKKLTGKDRLKV